MSSENTVEKQGVSGDEGAGPESANEASAVPEKSPLEAAEERAAEADKKFLYLTAEFDNFRKRMQRERADFLKYGHEGFLRDQLQILDNLQRALEHARAQKPEGQSPFGQVVLGVEMIYQQFLDSMRNQGVVEIKAVGEKFDPTVHEAVAEEASASVEPNKILREFQRGYTLHGRLLRAAKVVVAKAPDEAAEKN